MGFFVYITEECLGDARKYNLLPRLEKFRNNIIKDQNLLRFPEHYPGLYHKKRIKKSFRLVAKEFDINGDTTVVFYRLLGKGNAYNQFLTAVRNGDAPFTELVKEGVLKKYIAAEKAKDKIPPKPELSKDEFGFLFETFKIGNDSEHDDVILESADWVERFKKTGYREKMANYRDVIEDLLSKPSAEDTVYNFIKQGYSILYRYFPGQKKLFLIAPLDDDPDDRNKLEARYKNILEADDTLKSDDMLPYAARSYPSYLVLDEDAWLNIEKEVDANLSLSPEELGVLESISVAGDDDLNPFPMFINGLAGSGKTTILQYLFADYLYNFKRFTGMAENVSGAPVYLTWSSALRDDARMKCSGILRYNQKYILESRNGDLLNSVEEHSPVFWKYQEFLFHFIKDDAEKERFRTDKYIDFPKFKMMWYKEIMPRKECRGLSPGIAWHVIRTFIKGMSPDDFLDSDSYNELPRKQQSVSLENFNKVYDLIWNGWYKTKTVTDEFWDDQDLTRFVISSDYVRPEFPAIFCDESQDFTQLELEFIFRLSLYSNRRIDNYAIKRIPFVFAGDPFQTLNPTGFRWESLKDTYRNIIIRGFDPSDTLKLDFNFQELMHNYRSSQRIVHLANIIQLFRYRLFDIHTTKIQKAWHREENPVFPILLDIGKENVVQSLKKELNDAALTIIVPCEEDEEKSYVEKNEIIKKIVKVDENGYPMGILSPMRAKGMEFPRVALFNFGGECPEMLNASVMEDLPLQSGSADTLDLEYFINKLYVAITRPRERLFIFEDEEHCSEGLWSIFKDNQIIKDLLTDLKDVDYRLKDQDFVLRESLDGYKLGEGRENKKEQAEYYLSVADKNKDSYLFRQASQLFKDSGQKKKAKLCMANALKLEGLLKEASEYFSDINQPKEALDCCWNSSDYPAIIKLSGKYTAIISNRIEYSAARYMQSQKSSEESRDFLQEVTEKIQGDTSLFKHANWEGIINELLRSFVKLAESEMPPDIWEKRLDSFKSLSDKIRLDKLDLGFLALYASNYSEALEIFEKNKGDYPEEYYRIRTKTSSYPENLEWLIKLEQYDKIIELWKNTDVKKHDLSQDHYMIIYHSYYKTGRYDETGDLINESLDDEILFLYIRDSFDTRRFEYGIRAGKMVIDKHLIDNDWPFLIELTLKDHTNSNIKNFNKHLENFNKTTNRKLLEYFIYKIADSQDIPLHPWEDRVRIAYFLEDGFLKSRKDWATDVPPEVVGAAFEKTKHFKFMITYYNKALSSRWGGPKYQSHFRERLVKSMYKTAEHWHSMEDGKKKYLDMKIKADRKHANWGLRNEKNIPEFPFIDSSSVIMAKTKKKSSEKYGKTQKTAGQTTYVKGLPPDIAIVNVGENEKWSVRHLDFLLSHGQKRLMVTNNELFQSVTFDFMIKDFIAGNDNMKFKLSSEKDEKYWFNMNWQLSMKYTNNVLTVKVIMLDLEVKILKPK